MFRKIIKQKDSTPAEDKSAPESILVIESRKSYAFMNSHIKSKSKIRAHLDKHMESESHNGDAILIHIRGLAQDEINAIDKRGNLTFNQKRDLQEKPRMIQEYVMEALARYQDKINHAASAGMYLPAADEI